MSPVSTKKKIATDVENKKGVENHKNAIIQLEEAIKHHREAAKQLEMMNNDQARISTMKANGHTEHALSDQK